MEPVGLAVGGVSLAALFTTVIDCVNYIRVARGASADHRQVLLDLSITRYRLSRWGASVGLTKLSQSSSISAAQISPELQVWARDELISIFTLFQKVEKTMKKYVDMNDYVSLDDVINSGDRNIADLVSTQKALVKKRQNKLGAIRKMSWACFDKDEITTFLDKLREMTTHLIEACVATEQQRAAICQQDLDDLREAIRSDIADAAVARSDPEFHEILKQVNPSTIINSGSSHSNIYNSASTKVGMQANNMSGHVTMTGGVRF